MSGKAKETASNTMEAIRKKMLSLKGSKEASADEEKSLQNRVVELNNLLKARDDEILQLGKKMMQVCLFVCLLVCLFVRACVLACLLTCLFACLLACVEHQKLNQTAPSAPFG